MQKYIFTLLLLCTASIARADRIVRIIEEPDYYTEICDDEDDYETEYDEPCKNSCCQRPIVQKTVYVQQQRPVYKRVTYVQQQRPVRPVIYRRPVYVYRNTSCPSSLVSGLFGFGVGTILGTALAQ